MTRESAHLAQLAPLGYAPLRRVVSAARLPLDRLRPRAGVGRRLALRLAARDLDVEPRARRGARELRLDGRRIALSKLECDLLRYLREREGQAVAREALLRDVWGYEWTGGANAVEVAVSGLRRKLGEHARAIETVRGVGYRLRPFSPG